MRRCEQVRHQLVGGTFVFGWRKKQEAFDWHAYVRTTIKLRREARRDRIDAARQAALDKAHAAGQAVAAGSKAAGMAAVAGAQAGAEHGAKGASWFATNLGRALTAAFGPLLSGLRSVSGGMFDKLKGFDLAGPLALVALIALTSGAYRVYAQRLDAEAMVALGLGALMLLISAPALLTRFGVAAPRTWAIGLTAASGIGAAALAVPILSGTASLPSFSTLGTMSLPGRSTAIEGRAQAVSGDALRLNGIVYILSGIEAPERAQACMRPGKRRWRCGEAAQNALEKLVRNKTTSCAPSGSPDPSGRRIAACTVDAKDLASDLVREGHVFAVSSMFGGYSTLETEARAKKLGIWNGEAERPSENRAKVWEAARKSSPDGCPIKGIVSQGGTKLYVMPGARDYKKASIRAAKGERWFCTEADAASAGWKPAG
jgi:endonuclease YncB( thermonuclease family)